MKKIIDATLFISIAVGILSRILKGPKATDLLIAYSVVAPFLLLTPRWIYDLSRIRYWVKKNWPDHIGILGIGILYLNIPGQLYFFDKGIQYDYILHFGAVFLATLIAFSAGMIILKRFNLKITKFRIIFITALIIFIGIFWWEWFQYFKDLKFGTNSFFDHSQTIEIDVATDILFGFVGMALALIWLFYKFEWWYRKIAE